MAVPSNFFIDFKCKTTMMAAGTCLLMGYFASIFVPPWFHPLIRLSTIPLGSLVAVVANLFHVRSYLKGDKRP
jgi:hypothetical protein